MRLIDLIALAIMVPNISWAIIGGVRDWIKCEADNDWAKIDRNMNIALRNVKCCVVNVLVALMYSVHTQWMMSKIFP